MPVDELVQVSFTTIFFIEVNMVTLLKLVLEYSVNTHMYYDRDGILMPHM